MKAKDPVIFGNRSLRTVEYTIRMTDDRFQWIKRAADTKGMSVSQFIFEAIDSACVNTTCIDVLSKAIKKVTKNESTTVYKKQRFDRDDIVDF